MRRLLLFIPLFLVLVHPGKAQLFEDFENSDGALFGIEGDGTLSIQATGGNPGKCLREDDSVLGLGSYVLLSPAFLGNWAVGNNDSLFFDYKTVNLSGGSGQGGPFHVELFGPGGVARFSPNWQLPSFNVWHKKAIPIDSAKWVTLSGTWTGLLQKIDRIRIYSEYVVGDEYSLYDNFRSTFTPIPPPPSSGNCSEFQPGAGFDGWSFANVTSPTVLTTDGNPPNCIRLTDQANTTSRMIAPPKFKGNWSALNGNSVLEVDIKIVATQTTLSLPSYFIRIQGKWGAAEVDLTGALVDSAKGKWHRYSFPLQGGAWQQVSGTWDSTLMQVTDVILQPEFLGGSGSETVFVDNFCIQQLTSTQALTEAEARDFSLFPNPASEQVAFPESDEIRLISIQGKTLLSQAGPAAVLELKGLKPGVYWLSGRRQGKPWTKRVQIRR